MDYATHEDLFDHLWQPDGLAEKQLPLFDAPPPQEELFARLRLARSRRVGPVTFRRLVAEHGSAVAALDALPDVAAAAGDKRYRPADIGAIRDEIRAARKENARLLTLGAPGYPHRLAELADGPPVLWAQGSAEMLDRPCVAVVGTRNASSLALRMTRRMAGALSEAGIVVVSGLARGIDAMAHTASVEGGTVAVHAGGLDRIYPPEHAALGAQIAEVGCALSERPFGYAPQARDFPRRNRIVSGLAQAVVVVEAAARSGSMITARDALDQGREVMAVPGHPLDGRASGCNLLLRDGATLVRSAEDVLEVLDGLLAPALKPTPQGSDASASRTGDKDIGKVPAPAPSDLQGRILALLSPVPTEEGALLRDLCESGDATPEKVAAFISEMELSGTVARRPGGGLVRV